MYEIDENERQQRKRREIGLWKKKLEIISILEVL